MSNRLNQEREERLQPVRLERGLKLLRINGLEPHYVSSTEIRFNFKGNEIKYFPYSGWHSGKGIKDGRGFNHLKKQIITERIK